MSPGALLPEAEARIEGRGGAREATTTTAGDMNPATVGELLRLEDARVEEVWKGYDTAQLIAEVKK